MIKKIKTTFENSVIHDIDTTVEDVNITENTLDGCMLDEIHFSATIRTQEDISELKRFLTIARQNINNRRTNYDARNRSDCRN